MSVVRRFVRQVLIHCGLVRRTAEREVTIELDLPAEADPAGIERLMTRVREMEDDMIAACLRRTLMLPRLTGVPGLRGFVVLRSDSSAEPIVAPPDPGGGAQPVTFRR